MSDRNQCLKENFVRYVLSQQLPDVSGSYSPSEVGLTDVELIDLFETQLISRHLDLHSRVMQKKGQSFYTIGSAGHEGNAGSGKAFSVNDMAFLHYRSGAFTIQRSKQVAGQTPIHDVLLSFAASKNDPISGGRHKVLGSKPLNIPPQTSTIASHLPKAMGAAFSIGLARRMGLDAPLNDDSVIVCSFGDASSNHSTAQGAINSAAWASYQSLPMPIVFVCEDNGIGISTRTPDGWVEANYKNRAGLHYITCNGLNVLDTFRASKEAAKYAKEKQAPVFLHVKLVRLLGHAGSDAEFVYKDIKAIEANEQQDPLLHTARLLIDNDILTPEAIVDIYYTVAEQVEQVAEQIADQPKLNDSEEVMASIVPDKLASALPSVPNEARRQQIFAHEKHNLDKPQHLAKLINWTLHELLAQYDNVVMLGEDIAKKGGVYNVTSRLVDQFGKNRVLNTLLDEQSILGGAIGLAHNGFIPMPEIQFLAYVHNAEDQIRGEAATLSFFSKGQFTNPMVIRVAGLAYQKGFGGHFHNDNSFAVFRDIPGVIIACPSNGADAQTMLRDCVKLAYQEQRVVIFLEPIALYMTKDLHEAGDGLWTFPYLPAESQREETDLSVKAEGDGQELCILTYGNGYYLSRKAQKLLEEQGISTRVVDLKWLAPLDEKGIVANVAQCKHTLIVDECRQTGSISEALVTLINENVPELASNKLKRICAQDSFIPLGSAAYHVLPSVDDIVTSAQSLVNK